MKFTTMDNIEPEVLKYWQRRDSVQHLRDRNAKGQKFYFLEGPPYTSGKIHLGHAWNMALKDMVLRYKRMCGLNVWDRMGYDMHGLPTEQKTMKKLGLENKEDIQQFGVAKFIDECKKFCQEMMGYMNDDFIRIGTTLDFSDPYQPIKPEFMEAEWWLIKQAHNKNRLYQGLRTMHWDSATQTSVAKHELEYKKVTDTAIYVKFQQRPGKFFIIWTTTPWTIPLNLAVMVNPELTYVDVSVGDEVWVLAKDLVKKVMSKLEIENYNINREYFGAELAGLDYTHPLGTKELLPQELQNNSKLFTVLLTTKYVDSSTGTGLVHSAPGCGPEDYEVGHENGIPPFNCVNEGGFFENFGQFSGLKAKTDDKSFIKSIEDQGALLGKEPYAHDYPHGERSHEPVIFRTTKQWFFKVEDLKEKMIAANEEIYWNPETAKNGFRSWLENLRDNSITKQRYWGTPVPIWQAEDGDYIVVGSKTELEQLSGQKVEDMHIPKIDEITITKNEKLYRRIPDVLDVWIDAGTVSWNCLNYPVEQENFSNLFPADFILEGKDQIRGWFNLLMVASFLAFDKPSFKNVYMNGFVTDVSGVKMSKSLGNIISPYEVTDKYGADVLRYYMCQANAGEDINFSWEECQVKQRNLMIAWNIHKMLISLSKENETNPFILTPQLDVEEKYIFSRLNSTIKTVTSLLEEYKLDLIIAPLEELYLDLSRTYIQLVRDKSSIGTVEEKQAVIYTIGKVLLEWMKMFSIVSPFVTEAMYLNLQEEFGLGEASISHYLWPKCAENMIDLELEESMEIAGNVIQGALHAREKAKLGLRWPIKEVIVVSNSDNVARSCAELRFNIMKQTNAKSINILPELPGVKNKIKADYSKIGPAFGSKAPSIIAQLATISPENILRKIEEQGFYDLSGNHLTKNMLIIEREVPEPFIGGETKSAQVYINSSRTEELDQEGYAREITRNVQSLRKKAGLQKQDRIELVIRADNWLEQYIDEISAKVGAAKISVIQREPVRKYKNSFQFTVKGKTFGLWFS